MATTTSAPATKCYANFGAATGDYVCPNSAPVCTGYVASEATTTAAKAAVDAGVKAAPQLAIGVAVAFFTLFIVY